MKKANLRRPPRPPTWNSPKGWCRLCGKEIIEKGVQNKRKNWHTECVGIWNVMSRPPDARRYVWHRDKGICQDCRKENWTYLDWWHVDHHKPLWESQGDLSYWHPDNLRLLCGSCHKSKTKDEAGRRALQKKKTGIDDRHDT